MSVSSLAPQYRTTVYTSATSGTGPFELSQDRNRVRGLFEERENRLSETTVEWEWPNQVLAAADYHAFFCEAPAGEDATVANPLEFRELLNEALTAVLVWTNVGGDTRWRHGGSDAFEEATFDSQSPFTFNTDTPIDEASRCIDRLVAGDSEDSSAWQTLTRETTPETIVKAGLDVFKCKGSEERLIATARVLAAQGVTAFDALAEVLESGIAEADYFLEPVIALMSADESRALRLVDSLFRTPHSWVRDAAFDVLDDASPAIRRRTLTHLARHDVPDVAAMAAKRSQGD
jgi:hypothetical protein